MLANQLQSHDLSTSSERMISKEDYYSKINQSMRFPPFLVHYMYMYVSTYHTVEPKAYEYQIYIYMYVRTYMYQGQESCHLLEVVNTLCTS